MDARYFGQQDWDAYAGAEPFGDGTEPVIATAAVEHGVEREMRTMVVSATGIEIIFSYETEDDIHESAYSSETTFNSGKLAMMFVNSFLLSDPDLAYELVNGLGFEQVL